MVARAPLTAFRFDAGAHEYVDPATGEVLFHITGLLERAGWVDDTFYTEESCERGHQVHRLTADYDLGALDLESCERSAYRGWLLAHVKAVSIIQPLFRDVEEPRVHPIRRFGGRPDRVGTFYGLAGVMEIKSGAPAKSHPIQTALQALLVESDLQIPAESQTRLCLYLKGTGKFTLEEHRNRRDFVEARRILDVYCPEAR